MKTILLQKCIICLNQCLIPYKPKLNCECKYSVHKDCFMRWWKDNNNCLICLTHTNLGMKQTDIYRRRRRNNIWRDISNHVELDDDRFPNIISVRDYMPIFKCLSYVFIILVLCFYFLVLILYY